MHLVFTIFDVVHCKLFPFKKKWTYLYSISISTSQSACNKVTANLVDRYHAVLHSNIYAFIGLRIFPSC